MPTPTHRFALLRRRAMFVIFMIPGLALSTWVTRTPDIRDYVGASTGQMGLILFGLSIGSMVGILSSGPLVSRFSTRPIIMTGMALISVSLVMIALSATAADPWMVAGGLLIFGLGMGSADVAMNVEGAAVEQALGRAVLPAMHGMYSVATVIGATLGFVANAIRLSILTHLVVLAVITAVCLVIAARWVPGGTGKRTASDRKETSSLRLLRDRRLLLIGVVVLCLAFAEGSANDWLPLIFVDGHGFSATAGAIAYAGFAASQAIGRFAAGYFLARFSRGAVVRASAVIGACGLALVIFVEIPALVVFSVFLWGLGVSVGYPVALSAAGSSGPNVTARVSLAATAGYLAFLVGPPVLGFLGEQYGLRGAMIVVLGLMAVALVAAPAVNTKLRLVER